MGRTHQQYLNELIHSLKPHSKTNNDAEVLSEWKFAGHMKSTVDEMCACGKNTCRYVNAVYNPQTKTVWYPIGSSCIEKFFDEDVVHDHKVAKKKYNDDNKKKKKKKMTTPPPCYTCYVHGCNGTTSDGRHRYCPQHTSVCKSRAKWTVTFGRHKGKKWQDVIQTDPSYLKWIVNKSGMYESTPNDQYYESNKITRAFLENELFCLNCA